MAISWPLIVQTQKSFFYHNLRQKTRLIKLTTLVSHVRPRIYAYAYTKVQLSRDWHCCVPLFISAIDSHGKGGSGKWEGVIGGGAFRALWSSILEVMSDWNFDFFRKVRPPTESYLIRRRISRAFRICLYFLSTPTHSRDTGVLRSKNRPKKRENGPKSGKTRPRGPRPFFANFV